MLRNIGALVSQHATGDPFETAYECGDGDFRRIVDQQVNVIDLSVAFDDGRFEIVRDPAKMLLKSRQRILIENLVTIFRHEDQMDMQGENAMSASAKVLIFDHRSIILLS